MAETATTSSEEAAITAPDKENEQPSGNQGEGNEERPPWLPDKFSSPEELAKAYEELEKKQGQAGSEKENDNQEQKAGEEENKSGKLTPDKVDNGEQDEDQKEAEKAVEDAGLDYDALQKEFLENGELSDESRQKLRDSNIPDKMIDSHIEAMQAKAQQTLSEFYEAVGGEEEYKSLIEWAGNNLSKEEIDAFNEAVGSGNVHTMKMAVNGLKSQRQAVEGAEGNRVAGEAGSGSDGEAYQNQEQMLADMRKPEYKNDSAFRQKVIERAARSNF
jgi:hypothetical protein